MLKHHTVGYIWCLDSITSYLWCKKSWRDRILNHSNKLWLYYLHVLEKGNGRTPLQGSHWMQMPTGTHRSVCTFWKAWVLFPLQSGTSGKRTSWKLHMDNGRWVGLVDRQLSGAWVWEISCVERQTDAPASSSGLAPETFLLRLSVWDQYWILPSLPVAPL